MFDLNKINEVITEANIPPLTEQPTQTFDTDFPIIEEDLVWCDRPVISVFKAGELYCLAIYAGHLNGENYQQFDLVRTWEDIDRFTRDMRQLFNREDDLHTTLTGSGKLGILISDDSGDKHTLLCPKAIVYRDVSDFPARAIPKPGSHLLIDERFDMSYVDCSYTKLTRAILEEPADPKNDALLEELLAKYAKPSAPNMGG